MNLQNCCWCRRPVPDNSPEFLTTSATRYCSESCFTQSRRASFKKAKTCDWCKHVRHAISYVDFQDGASQLQFCSDKCLNQYKMQIFCKETQAHLDMNPHLREQGLEAVASGNGTGLITPDLWLRNCRSRSASPASTLSVSPGPPGPTVIMPNNTNLATGSSSSPGSSAASNLGHSSATPHKPMISVAPVSKLMSKNVGMLTSMPVPTSNRGSPKHNRKKRPLRSSISGGAGSHADLSSVCVKGSLNAIARDAGSSTASVASGLLGKAKSLLGATSNNNLRTSPGVHLPPAGASASSAKPSASVLNQFAGSSVQDLHMSVPPLSPMLEQQTPPHPLPPHALNASGHGPTTIPPAFFATPPGPQPPNSGGPHQQLPPGAFPPHPPAFLSSPGAPTAPGMLPRYPGTGWFPGFPPPPHITHPPPDLVGGLGLGALLGAPPPVTVMVPYPIIIPLPIPIPVPLPVVDFYKAYLSPEERAKLKQKENSQANAAANEPSTAAVTADDSDCEPKIEVTEETVNEEPLDFTKTKELEGDEPEKPGSSLKRALSEEHLTATTTTTTSLSPVTPTTNITATTAVTPSPEDSPCSPTISGKATHCIVRTDDTETPKRDLGMEMDDIPAAGSEMDDAKQKLPKFKITRLQTKRTLIQTKETPTTPTTAVAECSRPLRKRKRIIDCDFQKLALKEAAAMDADGADLNEAFNVDAEAKAATTASVGSTACTSNTKAQSKK
ncbi:sine oculis-binding protein homolog A [Rhagoletis pomonella]|uniref:sine oculis-binding protein homolog A n=1 Tax=Rhagoletis pomonella TaxID=28610 RepID=UPI00177B5301|nr:sine oculis-binding protein homolog A [Rhagoletis pomonella]